MEKLPEQIRQRNHNAALLRAELAGLDGLTFQQIPRQVNVHSCYLLLGRIDAAQVRHDAE